MGLNSQILTIKDPTIKLDEIKTFDFGESESGAPVDSMNAAYQPFVKINGYVFDENEIDNFNLKVVDKYPELTMTLRDSMGVFSVATFPRDGDVLSLRIKNRNKSFKDVRMDFHIIDFKNTTPVTTVEKSRGQNTYFVKAYAKLPGFYTDECKSYGKATSYDHILNIAEDLQLGFATNIDATDDAMTRLCAYQSKLELLNDTVLHSYISDDAFQTFSIDQFYYINYVNLQKIFDAPEDIELTEMVVADLLNKERPSDSDEGEDSNEVQMVLTNHPAHSNTAAFIESHNLINNSTKIALENGYKRRVQYFDINKNMIDENDTLNEFDIESLVSANIKDHEEPLKGRRNSSTDEYSTHIKHKYVGLQDSTPEDGNVHLNWHYSAINNIQNMVELDKMKLVVELATPNPAIYRYLKVPVVMFNFSKTSVGATEQMAKDAADKGFEESQANDNNSANVSDEDATQNDHIQDPFLTGFYVVMGMEYKYSGRGSKITQVLHLARREWPARMNNV